ncbi:MAG: crotonyl-CoA carboxylase/reductase [Polyangiales bacterium]
MSTKTLYALGETPPTGVVPSKMLAQVIRPERYGKPQDAFRIEEVDTPTDLRPDEVLVWVMAAGVNYNNVWAALGTPVDVVKARGKDRWFPDTSGFHIGGSDASGIVWKVGNAVRDLNVGDEVVLHCGQWSRDDPAVKSGRDPMYGESFRIWGYETSWGSFAQFTKVQAQQCLPKPPHLSWAAAASYMLVGATAFRMLCGWEPNTVKAGDVVLVWGGAGGLGTQAIQIAAAFGALPVAVVSDASKVDYCQKLGAKGCILRNQFDHWGLPPDWRDGAAYGTWLKKARKFGEAIWEAVGDRKSPQIVFEHPGEATIPTSILCCDTGGMVVICAGTTGFAAQADLRYLWMRQKRLQGSHFANGAQARAYNALVLDGRVDPCHSLTLPFEDIPRAHTLMHLNQHPPGNMSCLVNAKE